MPYFPDKIEIPGRRKLRKNVVVVAILLGLLAAGFFIAANGKGFLQCTAASVGLVYVATKIKTFREYKSGGGIYR